MKREIKFRGKFLSDNKAVPNPNEGRWVYGDLVHNAIFHCGKFADAIYEEGNVAKIDPDTVGQFTGLRDKQGVDIYEGDVVEVFDFSSVYASKYTGVVSWYRGAWVVSYEDATFGTIAHPLLVFDDFADRKTLVIGNIHDNPELLNNEHYEK